MKESATVSQGVPRLYVGCMIAYYTNGPKENFKAVFSLIQ